MKVLFPIKRVLAYDMDKNISRRYAEEMGSRFDLDVVPVSTPREAVSGCDIVVTSGPILKKPHATIQAGWMDAGAFASLVDFDTYWHPDAMAESDKFCTDDIQQLLHYQQNGYFQDIPALYADLAELVVGQRTGRETSTERTMTANLGLALEDMAVAPLIYQRALEKGIGTLLAL